MLRKARLVLGFCCVSSLAMLTACEDDPMDDDYLDETDGGAGTGAGAGAGAGSGGAGAAADSGSGVDDAGADDAGADDAG